MKNNLRNRILAMLLSVLMLVGMIPVFGAETDSVVIEIGSVSFDRAVETAVNGYYLVDVPVKVTKNEGFISIKLNINYDDELKLAGWTD